MEFFIQNLCREILSECSTQDIDCHSNFILYYLQLLALDPIWNLFPTMKEIFRLDALRIINFVVEKMKRQYCPCIITLKIQMYFECNFEDKSIIIETDNTNFRNKLKPLEDEIIEMTDEAQVHLLRKRMIYYITLWRGLGNPTKVNVYREARQALNSIYDDEDFLTFMTKPADTKEHELFQIARICSGIRLFNWSCKKGGEGIENLPQLAKNSLESISNHVVSLLVATMDKINFLTSAVDYAFLVKEESEVVNGVEVETYSLLCEVPATVDYSDVEYAKDLIIVYRQQEVFFRQVMNEIDNMESYVKELDDKFDETLVSFHSQASLKAGVPTDVVFPIFFNLDQNWKQYQNEIIYISKLNQILTSLDIYVKDLGLNMEVINLILGGRKVLTDAERTNWDDLSVLSDYNEEVVKIGEDDEILNGIQYEFLGFCPWKLVETQGGLIPGNLKMGVFKYKEKFYLFSCPEALYTFQDNPKHWINEVLELARKKTELIPLLKLKEDLLRVQTIKDLVVEQQTQTKNSVVTFSVEIQTDVQPVHFYIDEAYKWNIWDWKRNAISLADNSKRKTVSCQTNASMNKNPVYVQTYDQKEAESQTKKDNYTNVPKPSTYFFGLRGRTDDKQMILDITEPVDK